MGMLDFLLSEKEKKRRAAIAVGLETGLFQECPVCREITEKQAPEQKVLETERLAEEWLTKFDPRVEIFKGDRKELKRLIRDVKEKAEYSCVCERV
jgi:hypothetical protein